MTAPLHFCRYCDALITEPDDAVFIAWEMENSGPGWKVWAHREHAHLAEPDPVATAKASAPRFVTTVSGCWNAALANDQR
ncbi:hypothetical protein [Streptomyces sp. PSKA30]|uniref:hypothetical protein n=1 Tax=Streptomyces sp. PSKA30 TaxID=2874597 RepID=UPI001CD178CE|nr:hypothetical protein [Streptomyces sp. PSKA30]MBZ9642360.1 hypothetical protein [Streptomyces sp. PSKA30]